MTHRSKRRRAKSPSWSKAQRRTSLGIEPLESRQLLAGDLVMFNDHIAGSETDVNATTYAGDAVASGPLKDIATGQETSITLSITDNGVNYASTTGTPATGTDAYAIFNGYVDFRSGTGASLEISGTDTYTHSFSGLDPVATYDFAGTAVRGRDTYTDRWTLVTLVGADAFTPSHSAGVGVVTTGLGTNQVAIWVGSNHLAGQGFVAQWLDIDPGADGQFQIISQQYKGPTPGVGSGDSSSGSKGYGLHGIRLVEHDPSMRVVASDPAEGAQLGSAPTTATIDFSLPITVSSLEASDLTVDGIAATGFTLVDSDTVVFQLPTSLAAGEHTLAMAAGAVMGEPGPESLLEFTTTFTVVATASIGNVAARDVAADSAVVGAQLLATGGDNPDITIYWGTQDRGIDPGVWAQQVDLGSGGVGTYQQTITGLSEQTEYFFRAQATNLAGASWAPATATFTTPSITLPAVTNRPATSLGAVSARLWGEVTDTGGEAPVVMLFYGNEDAGTGSPVAWDHSVVLGPQAETFSRLVTGLATETTYYFRAQATNTAGTVWATPSLSFATAAEGDLAVVINELHYDPDIKTELVEFVELYNAGEVSVDLSDWMLTDAVEYTIPIGTTLDAGEYLIISQDPAAVQSKFGVPSLGPFSGRLNNDGEDVRLRDATGVRRDLVDYQLGFPWPTVGDAPGRSIQLIHPSFDNELGGNWRSALPTPGAPNGVLAANAAPQLRHVQNDPKQPRSDQDVTITVKATDPDGVAQVTLAYQLVSPGDYIAINDPRYNTNWTTIAMRDDGTAGDLATGDNVFTAVLPAAFQTHRGLVRYRITASDNLGVSITAPYADDMQPNFAYFVYDDMPSWTGAAQPGVTPEVTYDGQLLESTAVYQLITTRESHEDAQFIPDSNRSSGYTGSDYLWNGALVYDGKVYDHIRYRARGGVWRYAMGKNMWKFDFNRGHAFQARDDYGKKYDTKWDKLNFSAIISQGTHRRRGEQGLFESVGFKLFNLAGSESPNTNYVQFRIVEDADENGPDQFSTDYQGLYLAIEQPDGRLLDEHGLPDGNFYKIERYNGQLNNQGPTQPSDGSDLDTFKEDSGLNDYVKADHATSSPATEQWWRDNFDLENYYSYRSIVTAISHYDISNGKNYFYYHNPETDLWSVHAWDLDLAWEGTADGGGHAFKYLIANRSEFRTEYRNRMREIRDLLYNAEQTGMLLDEMASFVYTPGEKSVVDADRAMWDYNPIMIADGEHPPGSKAYVRSDKAKQGLFYTVYRFRTSDDFAGMIEGMKVRVNNSINWIDSSLLDDESLVPRTPTISYVGSEGFPTNGLALQTTSFQAGSAPFAALEWRVAEVTDPTSPNFDPSKPRKYEIESDWESGELSTFDNTIQVPGSDLDAGKTYRARVRMKDANGYWGHWSDPVQFVTAAPEGVVIDQLRISEINYNPYDAMPQFGDLGVESKLFEFVELTNIGDTPISLLDVQFTKGITFTFGDQMLEPGAHTVVVQDLSAFESRYGTLSDIAGQFTAGSLSNSGERIQLLDANGGVIVDFTYNDSGDWPGRADGKGSTLEIVDPIGDYNSADNWRSSNEFGGSPGSLGTGPVDDVIVNEVLSHSDGNLVDKVELYNTTGETIDLSKWYLSDTSDNLFMYQVPTTTSLAPSEYLVFDETELGFALDGQFGDDVWLIEADNTTGRPLRFADHVDFDATDVAVSLGRWPNGDANWMLFPMTSPTFGEANLGPVFGDLLISEVMYDPGTVPAGELANITQPELEFVEILNNRDSAGDISNWAIEGINFTFPNSTIIPAHEPLVVVRFDPILESAKATAFRNVYGIDSNVALVGPASGRLNNAGEMVKLLKPEDPVTLATGSVLVDAVRYDNDAPWPTDVQGTGKSLTRTSMRVHAPLPTSWVASDATPGSVQDATLIGDWNDDGVVDQGDLDLVLLNWGATSPPTGWTNDDFGNAIGQDELDAVRNNWGLSDTLLKNVAITTTVADTANDNSDVTTATEETELKKATVVTDTEPSFATLVTAAEEAQSRMEFVGSLDVAPVVVTPVYYESRVHDKDAHDRKPHSRQLAWRNQMALNKRSRHDRAIDAVMSRTDDLQATRQSMLRLVDWKDTWTDGHLATVRQSPSITPSAAVHDRTELDTAFEQWELADRPLRKQTARFS